MAAQYEATHHASVLAVGCIDFRYTDIVIAALEQEYGYTFDYMTLAGASLFVNSNRPGGTKVEGVTPPAWRQTYLEHVNVAKELHHIKGLVVVQHMDCGAFKLAYGDLTPLQERAKNIQNARQLKERMAKEHPELFFKAYLAHLDGHVETLIL